MDNMMDYQDEDLYETMRSDLEVRGRCPTSSSWSVEPKR